MAFHLDSKLLLSLLILPFAALACGPSDDGSGGKGGTAGAGAAGGTGGAGGETSTSETGGGGAGGAPMKCEGPGYGGAEKDVNVGVVKVHVVDQNGDPAANTAAQACGTDIYIAETTNSAGDATAVVNQPLKNPAFKYGDGFEYAKLAVTLPEGDSEFDNLVTAKLPADGEAFAAGGSVKSGGVVIEIPADGTLEFDLLSYPDEVDQVFRAEEIPVTPGMPALDPAIPLDALFGVAPLETVFCPPAAVHVPNTPQYAAGAEVEFYIQGFDIAQHWAAYGTWQKVSDGKVSDDGSEIVTADGQGFPVLSTFGVKLK